MRSGNKVRNRSSLRFRDVLDKTTNAVIDNGSKYLFGDNNLVIVRLGYVHQ